MRDKKVDNMKQIGICGNFGTGTESGQTVKTKTLYNDLCGILGDENVCRINSAQWKRKPFDFFCSCVRMAKQSDVVIILPAQRGLRLILPLFLHYKKTNQYKLFYSVIGGWLPALLKNNRRLRKQCRRLNGIFVETNTMALALRQIGLDNTTVIPNYKHTAPLECPKQNAFCEPYPLIFFSRVAESKGIFEAILAVRKLNEQYEKQIFTLDIYGPVAPDIAELFSVTVDDCGKFVRYCGVSGSDTAGKVMQRYFLHLFPTLSKTEGIPGSVLDALYAGIPTVASRWNSCEDILEDGKTGLLYEFGNREALCEKLAFAAEHQEQIAAMRKNCFDAAAPYRPETVLAKLIKELGL